MKSWNNLEVLELIGKVVDIQVGMRKYPSVYLENLKLPRGEEGPVMVYFITERGRGHPGFIRGRGVSILATGETPELEGVGDINALAGDLP